MATSTIKSYANNAGMLNGFLTCKQVYVAAGSTKNITFDSNTQCFIISCATSNAHKGAWLAAASSNGSMSKVDVVVAGNISLDTSTANTLKVTNASTSNGVNLSVFILHGDISA